MILPYLIFLLKAGASAVADSLAFVPRAIYVILCATAVMVSPAIVLGGSQPAAQPAQASHTVEGRAYAESPGASRLQQPAPLKKITWNPDLGMYEVVMRGQVVYMSRNFKYLFVGRVIDISKANPTVVGTKAADSAWIIPYSALNRADAIAINPGRGRSVSVFFDPDCPFCRAELPLLRKLKGVTVYVYLFPLSIHPNAMHDAGAIWCAKDRAKALFEPAARVSKPTCKTPADDISAFAAKYGIEGTPTIILDNGKVLQGVVDDGVVRQLLGTKRNGKEKTAP